MKKTLVLITNHFPYGKKETFIESEYPYLDTYYDKIIIISRNVSDSYIRETKKNTEVYRIDPTTKGAFWLISAFLILTHLLQIVRIYRAETGFRDRINKRINSSQKRFLLKRIIKSLELKHSIDRIVGKNDSTAEITYYSYWFSAGASAISMMKKKRGVIRVARAHGGDLYEYASEYNYTPLAYYNHSNLDAIFFISKHGKNYFRQLINEDSDKQIVAKLGVKGCSDLPEPENRIIRFVSCSSMVDVKRVDKIIDLISNIPLERNIQWIHFGDGPLHTQLKNYSHERFKDRENISFVFKGQVPNHEILKYYSSNFIHLFINLSISEGIPVSIMEAISCGIPVAATDAGGTHEIVNDITGILIPVDFDINKTGEKISSFIKRNENNREEVREQIIQFWDNNYNADRNYPFLLGELEKLRHK